MEQESNLRKGKGLIGYDPALDEEILEFQKTAYPDRREDWILPRWRWMFLDSARRLGVEPMVWMYRKVDGIVAHQGAIAVRLKVDEKEITTGWFVETMATESVRGRAIGPMVVKKALEDMPFNLSLGQTEQMRELQYAMGWQRVAPLLSFAFVLNPHRVLAEKFSSRISRVVAAAALGLVQSVFRLRGRWPQSGPWETRLIDRFTPEHDQLWADTGSEHRCSVVRDASYLNWKYVDQPGQSFIRLELRRSGRIVGHAALMIKDPDENYGYRRGFIVDLVAPFRDQGIVCRLLDECRRIFEKCGVDLMVFNFFSDKLQSCAKRFGFIQREPARVLLVASGSVDKDIAGAVLARDSWYITMGDSDVDRPW